MTREANSAAQPEPLLVSIPETQRLLGDVSRSHVYTLLGTGELAGAKIGRRQTVTMSSIRALVARKAATPTPGA